MGLDLFMARMEFGQKIPTIRLTCMDIGKWLEKEWLRPFIRLLVRLQFLFA